MNSKLMKHFYVFILLNVLVANCQLQWQRIATFPTLPSPRKFAAVEFDAERNFLIVFGGRDKNGLDLNDTWILDVSLGRWYDGNRGPSPEQRHGCASGFYLGKVYLFGGCSSKRCYNDVWSFDSGSFTWEEIGLESLMKPKQRGFMAYGMYPGTGLLHISGGFNGNDDFLSDTYSFDVERKRWFVLESWQSPYDPSVPHPRGFQASVMTSATELMIMGGCLRHGHCPSPDSWIFNLQTKQWSQLPYCYYANAYSGLEMLRNSSSTNEYAVLFGGQTRNRQIIGIFDDPRHDELAVYDFQNSQWSIKKTEGHFPSQRFGFGFVSGRSEVYLFGGESLSGTLLNDLFVLTGNVSGAETTRSCKTSFFTLISLHGLFMFLGFAVFLQTGSAVAQYGFIGGRNSEKINWRYMHKFIQVTGCLFVFCGFICGLVSITDRAHFQSVHGGFGFFIVLLLISQALIGFISLKFSGIKSILMCIHYWTGVAILLTSFINISLGLFLASSSLVVWILWFVFIFLIMIVLCVIQTGIFVTKSSNVEIK